MRYVDVWQQILYNIRVQMSYLNTQEQWKLSMTSNCGAGL